ncbi:MAG TPA: fumarylacetoacetate hydrolase family protein [Tepidisphaeraceae bacterium]|nr:fumarylacetoacetate hydrolase family protein [Tepidisphaeraceae bacterium]
MATTDLPTTFTSYTPRAVLPRGGPRVGRCWAPAGRSGEGVAGPCVVTVRDGAVIDLSETFETFSALLNHDHPLEAVRSAKGRVLAPADQVIRDSLYPHRADRLIDEQRVVLLAPNDLCATKACGVTFIRSLLERVVEEKAQGDPTKAADIRAMITHALGDDLSKVKPGSPQTVQLKKKFIDAGIWSQYLEVGIGPNVEIFTKAQPMSSVGYGQQVGVLPDSMWNNPEPEVVLAVSRRGRIVGVTLGNDVNLRDYEGRSALLLGEAKDQNGSSAIGPMVRLMDESFSVADITRLEVRLSVQGLDGFTVTGANRMSEISRSPEEIAQSVVCAHHQYPDATMIYLGTMFAPTEDRSAAGGGFTHHLHDRVEISVPQLGTLVNWVNHTDRIPPWEYGASELVECLVARRMRRASRSES